MQISRSVRILGSMTLPIRKGHFTVLNYLAMNASEAGGDLALIQISQLFSYKRQLVGIRTTWFAQKSSEVCIKTRSTPASLPFRDQVTKPTTVKWYLTTENLNLKTISRFQDVLQFRDSNTTNPIFLETDLPIFHGPFWYIFLRFLSESLC